MAAGYDTLPLRVRTGLLGEATAMASAGLLPLPDALALVAKAKDAKKDDKPAAKSADAAKPAASAASAAKK